MYIHMTFLLCKLVKDTLSGCESCIHLVESLFDAMVRYSLQAHFSCNACNRSYTAWTCREHQHDCGKRGAKRPMSDHVT